VARAFQISFILIAIALIITIGYNTIHSTWNSLINNTLFPLLPICIFFAANLTVQKKVMLWKCLYGFFLLIALLMTTRLIVALFNTRLNMPFSVVMIYLTSVVLPFYFSHILATTSPLALNNGAKPVRRFVLILFSLAIIITIAVNIVPLMIVGSAL